MSDQIDYTKYHPAALSEAINDLRSEVRALKQQIEEANIKPSKPKKVEVPFVREFPNVDRVTQIKAQLFHNEPNRSGKHGGARPPEWNLKVSVWTCEVDDIKKYDDGTVKSFNFHMCEPSELTAKYDDTWAARAIASDMKSIALVGCRDIRGYGRTGGSKKEENQMAMITDERNLVLFVSNWPDPINLSNSTPARGNKANTPIEIWTWTIDT